MHIKEVVGQPIPLKLAWEHGSSSPCLLHGLQLRRAGSHTGRQRNQKETDAVKRDSKERCKRSLRLLTPSCLLSSTKASTAPRLARRKPPEPSRNLRSSPYLKWRTIKREASLQSILPIIFNIKLGIIICILGETVLLGKNMFFRAVKRSKY